MKMTGSLDHDFLLMMMPHHQSALEMAEAYLKEGKTPEIKAAAEKIIEAQKRKSKSTNFGLISTQLKVILSLISKPSVKGCDPTSLSFKLVEKIFSSPVT